MYQSPTFKALQIKKKEQRKVGSHLSIEKNIESPLLAQPSEFENTDVESFSRSISFTESPMRASEADKTGMGLFERKTKNKQKEN